MAIFHFFKMAAVRHLGLVLCVLGPPTQYENFNILHVKLENAYSRPKIGVLGDFAPKMGSSMNERNVCNIGKMEEL